MNRSQVIDLLAAALATAQGQMGGATKSSTNPFFDSRYADLASVWGACREALANNALSVVQTAHCDGFGEEHPLSVTVTTLLMHASGQWIESELQMWPKENTPQSIGTCISYARRYALAAMVGVYQEDDDANRASGKTTTGTDFVTKPEALPHGMTEVLDAIFKKDVNRMRLAWNDLMGLGTVEAVWKLLNTKQKATARELLQQTTGGHAEAGNEPNEPVQ